jgi:vesicle-fusing ATPase
MIIIIQWDYPIYSIFPEHIVEQLGIHHVRGMLLYGPPGCGKTLIARQIGKVLNAREPKIVNGPEILDKFVGGSEQKIRDLFEDAEKEQKAEGANSMLHIIIFDEFDAICKARGSSNDSSGVSDSIVNQLLSKIDGVDSINNVLIIGMTNRKDMIDDAVLRPGRLEVHVEIGLPDEAGRVQILTIHTNQMRTANPKRITEDAETRIAELAARTKNFSGAELSGLVRTATASAMDRCVNKEDMTVDADKLCVEFGDFEIALTEVHPKFGAPTADLELFFSNGIVDYGSGFTEIQRNIDLAVNQIRTSEKTPLLSLLLEGDNMCGKTALAAHLAVTSGFPFVRMISADSLIGMSEQTKCNHIHKVFMDSFKSPLSVILLDDLERIIEYTPLGPRFSNMILQTLLVLLKKPPPPPNRLLIVGTTSISHLLEDVQLISIFNLTVHIPKLEPKESRAVLQKLVPMTPDELDAVMEHLHKPIALKQLLMVAEMARNEDGSLDPMRFFECIHTVLGI